MTHAHLENGRDSSIAVVRCRRRGHHLQFMDAGRIPYSRDRFLRGIAGALLVAGVK